MRWRLSSPLCVKGSLARPGPTIPSVRRAGKRRDIARNYFALCLKILALFVAIRSTILPLPKRTFRLAMELTVASGFRLVPEFFTTGATVTKNKYLERPLERPSS
jgi:hypothetical protein